MHFPSGRDALHLAFREIGAVRGDRIIAPALICRSAIEPLIDAGAVIDPVDCGSDLNYNEADLEELLARVQPRAVLAVHYFGRVPPLSRYSALCSKYGSDLIEDRCHCLPSTQALDGDISGACAVYSLRKLAAVHDGGLLVFRGRHVIGDHEFLVPRRSRGIAFALRRLAERGLYSGVMNPFPLISAIRRGIARFRVLGTGYPGSGSSSHGTPRYSRPLKTASAPVLNSLRPDILSDIGRRRCENYRQLARLLQPLQALMPQSDFLSGTSIPMAFPIIDVSRAMDLPERLRQAGIGAYRWPGDDIPASSTIERYPMAASLARRLVLLPVHQDLSQAQIEYMAAVLKRAIGGTPLQQ